MNDISAPAAPMLGESKAIEIARRLGRSFFQRAIETPDEDIFVADNVARLREAGLVDVGVPQELGGGGAGVAELATMLRTIAYHCGSTGLAFSMHTHQVAVPAWRWRHQPAVKRHPELPPLRHEELPPPSGS